MNIYVVWKNMISTVQRYKFMHELYIYMHEHLRCKEKYDKHGSVGFVKLN